MEEFFERAGPLARRLPGWEPRPQQTELATAVAAALERGDGPLVAEAGTGVGKSFGYLLPAIVWAEQAKKRVIVSTRTKALQEQLAAKDLPFLQSVLPQEFTWTVAVGRNNYLCLRRLFAACDDSQLLFPDDERATELAAIRNWSASKPETGVRNELSFVPNGSVWEEVQAEQGNCLGPECRHFEPCYWQRGKQRMRTANIVIVNHALYFADLALRLQGVSYLPDHDCVIFDEAHHLEAIASEGLGLRFSPAQLEWTLRRLANRTGSHGLLVRLGLTYEATLVAEIRRLAEDYWATPTALLGEREGAQLRLARDQKITDRLSDTIDRLAVALRQSSERYDNEQAMELVSRSRRLQELALTARAFADETPANEVRWIERERRQVVLRASPISIADKLRTALFDQKPRAILTSATLGPPDNDFAWLRSRLGITHGATLRVGSPFPYEDNVVLQVEQGLPDPGTQPLEFDREAATRIRDLCIENDGRALVLCTSWRFLTTCRDALVPACREAGLPLLVQGERPLTQLIDEKRQRPESVLVGTDSLWEGIDLPGDAVTLVILTRFPFPVPSHPLIEARCEDLERRGHSSFHEYSVPLALLKFKQGFGRLVRSASDKGKVVVLDPRALRKQYGRRFLDALPRCRRADA